MLELAEGALEEATLVEVDNVTREDEELQSPDPGLHPLPQ